MNRPRWSGEISVWKNLFYCLRDRGQIVLENEGLGIEVYKAVGCGAHLRASREGHRQEDGDAHRSGAEDTQTT